jgi:hypothetical protein
MPLLNVYHQGNIIHSEIVEDESQANEIFNEKISHLDNYNKQISNFTLTDLHPDYIEELKLKEESSKEKKKK